MPRVVCGDTRLSLLLVVCIRSGYFACILTCVSIADCRIWVLILFLQELKLCNVVCSDRMIKVRRCVFSPVVGPGPHSPAYSVPLRNAFN